MCISLLFDGNSYSLVLCRMEYEYGAKETILANFVTN